MAKKNVYILYIYTYLLIPKEKTDILQIESTWVKFYIEKNNYFTYKINELNYNLNKVKNIMSFVSK